MAFKIPQGKELPKRLKSVLEIIYLIFNEGFHSNKKDILIQKELCGEAIRLCKLLFKNKQTKTPDCYALFALMCFHSARLDAKINTKNELLDLKTQDRNNWSFPLIQLGSAMMNKAVKTDNFSRYHYEAAIVGEHIKAPNFEQTNWDKILHWYKCLYELQPSTYHLLTMAVVCLQNENYVKANYYFEQIKPNDLAQRVYLFYSAKADYYSKINKKQKSLKYIDLALEKVTNKLEREFLEKKKKNLFNSI